MQSVPEVLLVDGSVRFASVPNGNLLHAHYGSITQESNGYLTCSMTELHPVNQSGLGDLNKKPARMGATEKAFTFWGRNHHARIGE